MIIFTKSSKVKKNSTNLKLNVMNKRQKKIEVTIGKLLSSEDHDFVVRTFLEKLKWPIDVKTDIEYFANEDDSDGARRGIGVHFLSNGDGVINLTECIIESHFSQSDIFSTHPHVYRFRNWFGGGRSLYVHKALLVLAHAVMIDKDEEVIVEPKPKSLENEKDGG